MSWNVTYTPQDGQPNIGTMTAVFTYDDGKPDYVYSIAVDVHTDADAFVATAKEKKAEWEKMQASDAEVQTNIKEKLDVADAAATQSLWEKFKNIFA